MQTFLPHADFEQSVASLDPQRLNAQRKETKQIIDAILHGSAWENHAAVRMWKRHVYALAQYGLACSRECNKRGILDQNGVERFFSFTLSENGHQTRHKPFWFGSFLFHRSHRLSLLYKQPLYYRERFPREPVYAERPAYVWPFFWDQWEMQGKELVLTCFKKPRRIKNPWSTRERSGHWVVFTKQPGGDHVGYMLEHRSARQI